MAQHEQFDVLGTAVTGELGEHLQDLAQHQVHQRDPTCWIVVTHAPDGAQNRTSQQTNRIYVPHRPRHGGRWRDHRQVINGILYRVRKPAVSTGGTPATL
jgi:hypothetical protein